MHVPTEYETVVNLKTAAKERGLTEMPESPDYFRLLTWCGHPADLPAD
jgi:hypothetical protein